MLKIIAFQLLSLFMFHEHDVWMKFTSLGMEKVLMLFRGCRTTISQLYSEFEQSWNSKNCSVLWLYSIRQIYALDNSRIAVENLKFLWPPKRMKTKSETKRTSCNESWNITARNDSVFRFSDNNSSPNADINWCQLENASKTFQIAESSPLRLTAIVFEQKRFFVRIFFILQIWTLFFNRVHHSGCKVACSLWIFPCCKRKW